MRTVPGVVIGIVKQVRQGQVILEFPWLDQSYRTDWVDIAAPMSGKKRGMFFMPEQDDEVLVAFDHGNFDHPYVVGFLWNGVDQPPETEVKNRVILTPGKHTLRFEDKDGAKKVVVESSSGHKIVLDDSPSGQMITVTTKGNLSVALDDKTQSIELRGGGRILALRNGQVQIS
jgi:uncharacterized protein involved in type VI secretion and phage assembly